MKKNFKEILLAEAVSVTGGVIAGTFMAIFTGYIELLPAFLILIPGFLGSEGNVFSALASRLSSALHVGYIKPKARLTKTLIKNVIASFLMMFFTGIFLGGFTYITANLLFSINDFNIVWVSAIASIVSGIIVIPIIVSTTYVLFAKGFDPDNIMGPYISTLCDIISVLSLVFAIWVISL